MYERTNKMLQRPKSDHFRKPDGGPSSGNLRLCFSNMLDVDSVKIGRISALPTRLYKVLTTEKMDICG